ncbi:MAG: thymidylate synthase [Candidatus Kerfeldbacteria bacterium]|nr:thymidylate synthase [Candidatus Kerfeldbacteria bacterium]
MQQYLSLLREILDRGEQRAERTGVGTISLFGTQRKYDLREGFPIVTTKKVNYRSIVIELLWFLTGSTNIQPLVKQSVNIWNEWPFQVYLEKNNLLENYPRYSESWKKAMAAFADRVKTDDGFAEEWGDLGPVYGSQWRRWKKADGTELDQIAEALDLLRRDPSSRRIIVSAWNAGEIQELIKNHHHAPPACHSFYQFWVLENRLDLHLYQRTADMALGVPFNISSYATLLTIIAQEVGLQPGVFTHSTGDAHIYLNHIEGVKQQLQRTPFPLPKLQVAKKPMPELTADDFVLEHYQHHPFIKFQIAV